jgi:hypothetical protein
VAAQTAVIAIYKIQSDFAAVGAASKRNASNQKRCGELPSIHVRLERISQRELNLPIGAKAFHCAHRAVGLSE